MTDDRMPRISELDPKFREPRTAAEMIPARQVQITALGERRCGKCGTVLAARDPATQTYESLWCGVSLDCPNRGCAVVCETWDSPQLAHYHGRPFSTDGKHAMKYTPRGWVDITEQEAAAFWASLAAWQERRHARMFPKRRRRTRPTDGEIRSGRRLPA